MAEVEDIFCLAHLLLSHVQVVDIEGSRRLVRFARSASKRLVHIDGGRHDLICNKPVRGVGADEKRI